MQRNTKMRYVLGWTIKKCSSYLKYLVLGGDYMIPVSQDEILSRFAGIPAVL